MHSSAINIQSSKQMTIAEILRPPTPHRHGQDGGGGGGGRYQPDKSTGPNHLVLTMKASIQNNVGNQGKKHSCPMKEFQWLKIWYWIDTAE